MSGLNDSLEVEADDRATWRAWLEANHATARGVWLVTWRASSGRSSLAYEVAVEEALCFGWVDGIGGRLDADRGKQYFAPRKLRSAWAATNKARVDRLVAGGRMAPAGLAAIARAKANGSWELLDSAERLEVPADLATALRARPPAATNFSAFPPSVRKLHLTWVALARRPDTRTARIQEIANAAARNQRARTGRRARGSGGRVRGQRARREGKASGDGRLEGAVQDVIVRRFGVVVVRLVGVVRLHR